MEESQLEELISPRISFSYDLLATPPPAAALVSGRRSDASLLVSRLPAEPEFDFATAVAAAADVDVAPADRLFAGGKLLPMPPLPPAPKPTTPCKPQQVCSSRVKAQQQQACQQQQIRRPGSSWASPFSRSSSVNSATTATATTTGAPRSAGRFGCPPFPLMRSWSVGSAAAVVARDGADALRGADAAGGHHRPHQHQYYKKFGGAAAATGNGGSRAYYHGGSRKGSSGSGGSHGGVRVRPVLNMPFIGASVSNVLSYLLCDCSSPSRTKKSRELF